MIDLGRFSGERFAVLGLARSGLASVRALIASGVDVVAWDDDADKRAAAASAGARLVDLAQPDFAWTSVAALIVSPGIPVTEPTTPIHLAPHPAAHAARHAGCRIISDIELLFQAKPNAFYIGVTGTNGKSTTTALIAHICALDGRPVAMGGNIGVPVLDLPNLPADGRYVLEMSSYQLEITHSNHFDVAVFLNISPDHLDRHGDMEGYVAAKASIFTAPDPVQAGAPQGAGFRRVEACRPALKHGQKIAAIIGADDEYSRSFLDAINPCHSVTAISAYGPPKTNGGKILSGIYAQDGWLMDSGQGAPRKLFDLSDAPALPGLHNAQNAAAAFSACRPAGIADDVIAQGLRSFPGLAHRIETVGAAAGVRFVNDSKATNADAAARALACFDEIYWIAGGKPKEDGITSLLVYKNRIREAFLIGAAQDSFAATLGHDVKHRKCGTLEHAVAAAFAQARADGLRNPVVLLSPACASFDQFKSFEHRGDVFRALAQKFMAEAAA